MSKLLFDHDDVLVINPKLAKAIGLNEAIILQQIHYWIENKYCAGHIHNGRKWVYNTVTQWNEQFPFISVSTIKRTMLDLRDKGLIDVEKLSNNGLNHTNYYSINYKALDAMKVQFEPIDEVNLNQSNGSNWSKPNRTETTTETPSKKPKVTKSDYSDLFGVFWATYPKKVGKDAAQKAFAKRKPDDKLLKDIFQAVELQKTTEQWQKDGGQYIPNPATWLNQGRWMDEMEGGGSSVFAGAI